MTATGSDHGDQEDVSKPCGLLGVLHEQTGMTVMGPNDATTWARMEAFVRFASKP